MNVQQKNDGTNGVFFIKSNNELLAEMTYRMSEGLIIIDHTEVDETLEGRCGETIGTCGSRICQGKAYKNISTLQFCETCV